MEQRIQRQVLVDVDLQAPAGVHRELGGPPRRGRLDPAGIGRQRLGPVDVADRLARPLADRSQVRDPGGDEAEAEVDRVGAGAAVGPLRGLLALAPGASGVAALAELVGALPRRLLDDVGALLAALGGEREQIGPDAAGELAGDRRPRGRLGVATEPAAGRRAKQAGALVVIVNAEPTNMDGLADAVLRGPISEILPAIVG